MQSLMQHSGPLYGNAFIVASSMQSLKKLLPAQSSDCCAMIYGQRVRFHLRKIDYQET